MENVGQCSSLEGEIDQLLYGKVTSSDTPLADISVGSVSMLGSPGRGGSGADTYAGPGHAGRACLYGSRRQSSDNMLMMMTMDDDVPYASLIEEKYRTKPSETGSKVDHKGKSACES